MSEAQSMNDSAEAAPGVPPQPRKNALAVAAAVLGFLGCIPGLGFVAIVLGVVALVMIAKSGGRQTGRDFAIAGIAMGLLMTALLTFLLLPAIDKFCFRHAHRTSCANNLHQIGMAVSAYAADNGGSFPPDLGKLYPEYVDNAEAFSCPLKPSKWKDIAKTRRFDRTTTSYVYVAGLKDGDPPTCVLAFDRPGNHGDESKYPTLGLNVMLIGGRVQWTREAELQKALAETRELARKQGREIRLVGE